MAGSTIGRGARSGRAARKSEDSRIPRRRKSRRKSARRDVGIPVANRRHSTMEPPAAPRLSREVLGKGTVSLGTWARGHPVWIPRDQAAGRQGDVMRAPGSGSLNARWRLNLPGSIGIYFTLHTLCEVMGSGARALRSVPGRVVRRPRSCLLSESRGARSPGCGFIIRQQPSWR